MSTCTRSGLISWRPNSAGYKGERSRFFRPLFLSRDRLVLLLRCHCYCYCYSYSYSGDDIYYNDDYQIENGLTKYLRRVVRMIVVEVESKP